MIQRSEYLLGNVSHSAYYAQFVDEHMIARVLQVFGKEQLEQAYAQDEYLNTIPLQRWDRLAIPLARNETILKKLHECGDYYSLCSGVCMLKQAAKMAIGYEKGNATMTEFTISHTADSLETGETVTAIRTTMRDGTVEQRCGDCEKNSVTPAPKSDKELLEALENFGYIASDMIARIDILTEKYDSVWSNNAHLFLGERCDTCHTRLGGWLECQCGWMGWGDDSHECTLYESDPELWQDVLDGFETGYVEE